MKHTLITKLLAFLLVFGVTSTVDAQRKKKRKKKNKTEIPAPKPKETPKKGAIQPYNKVITDKTVTDEGLFKVHKNDEKFLFEIPDSLLEREMLMVTRIAKTASGLGFGGGKANTQVLRWQKKGKKIVLRVVSHSVVANDSLPVHEAVVNSNFEPVLYTFPIKAFGKDSTSTIVDVTDLFAKDIKALGIPTYLRKQHKISRLDALNSFIENVKSYPLNIESRHVKTYSASAAPSHSSTGSITVEMSNSMILLPELPMKRRYHDQRVGWFTSGQVDYGQEAHKSKKMTFLDRWKLEVKAEDIEKFKRGELVVPKKQIVYYIDRATPKKWAKYIKQGIEDWQIAFEAAGFKNAIIAKTPPTKEEDPDWSPEDVRYSVVRYLASPIPNANGPHVSDPRSGEILESDINWYHNVMTLLHNWYFIQTAAINPDARGNEFKDEVMGRLIRFVSSHEVGHTLGLPHNMGSSCAYSAENLRNAEFTKKNGTAPSIMDYARFNYIAQPGDEGVAMMPEVGCYDKYAISWGYRPILNTSAEEEKKILDAWILKHAGDPLYRFGHQQVGEVIDPSSQTEDLGSDAIVSSQYGIANLKRIVPRLEEWTSEKGENYDNLKTMYGQVIGQFNRYMGHVAANIGGVYEQYKASDQKGAVYTYVDKNHQKNCLQFIQSELFETPHWMLDENIFSKIEYSGAIERIRGLQVTSLSNILSVTRMARLIENEAKNGANAYTLTNMMSDLRKGIWKEIYSGKSSDIYRRNLQRAYVEELAKVMTAKSIKKGPDYGGYRKGMAVNTNQSDIKAMVRGELKRLQRDVKKVMYSGNTTNRYHLQDIEERIDVILNPIK